LEIYNTVKKEKPEALRQSRTGLRVDEAPLQDIAVGALYPFALKRLGNRWEEVREVLRELYLLGGQAGSIEAGVRHSFFDQTWNLKSCLTLESLTGAQKRAIGDILGPEFLLGGGVDEADAPATRVTVAAVPAAPETEQNPFQANASGTDWAIPAVFPSEPGAALSNPGEREGVMPAAPSPGAVLNDPGKLELGLAGTKAGSGASSSTTRMTLPAPSASARSRSAPRPRENQKE
jgi:hypothetical protein